MLAPSALVWRLTAPIKYSRPVLSEVCPLLYKTVENPVEVFKFHDFPLLFPWPFQVFKDLRFSCRFQKLKTFFNGQKLRRSLKCVPFTLLNHSSLSYIVLALSSAANNLSTKTLIFHDFQGPRIKFHDFTGLEMPFLNSMTFQVFHDLYEPCFKTVNKKNLLRKWQLVMKNISKAPHPLPSAFIHYPQMLLH